MYTDTYKEECEKKRVLLRDSCKIHCLGATKIEAYGDFLMIRNYGSPVRDYPELRYYAPDTEPITINANEIREITPSGHWGLDGRYISDEVLRELR